MRWPMAMLVAMGCATGPGEAEVTWHADVRPVVEQHCVSCHAEGGIGPFSMTSDAVDWDEGPPWWAEAAVASASAGTMPPWPPSDDCHPVADARSLPEADRATLEAWRDAGYPEGDPSTYVPPAQTDKVTLGEPDLTLRSAEAYTPDASRPDDYRCVVVDHTFDADAWVTAFTVEPDAVSMVHHVILYRLGPEYAADVAAWDAADEGPGYTCFGSPGTWDADTLAGWAPGQRPEIYEEGVARRIEAGSTLVIQVHYNTLNAKAGAPMPSDRSGVNLWLLPEGERPDWQMYSVPIAKTSIDIPAGEPNHVEVTRQSLSFIPIEIEAVGVFPHMHQLGRKIRMVVEREDGSRECVANVPDWDFNWQGSYFFPKDDTIRVGPRDRLELKCVYDNSAANQPVVNGAPQEPRDVRWGDGSYDEMCLMYAHVLVPPGFI